MLKTITAGVFYPNPLFVTVCNTIMRNVVYIHDRQLLTHPSMLSLASLVRRPASFRATEKVMGLGMRLIIRDYICILVPV